MPSLSQLISDLDAKWGKALRDEDGEIAEMTVKDIVKAYPQLRAAALAGEDLVEAIEYDHNCPDSENESTGENCYVHSALRTYRESTKDL